MFIDSPRLTATSLLSCSGLCWGSPAVEQYCLTRIACRRTPLQTLFSSVAMMNGPQFVSNGWVTCSVTRFRPLAWPRDPTIGTVCLGNTSYRLCKLSCLLSSSNEIPFRCNRNSFCISVSAYRSHWQPMYCGIVIVVGALRVGAQDEDDGGHSRVCWR